LADSPSGYWRLGEASGAVTALDSSPHGDKGTYVGSPALGVVGAVAGDTAVRFNGTDQYVSIGSGSLVSPLASGNALTLEAWIEVDALPAGSVAIVSKASSTQYEWILRLTAGEPEFKVWSTDGNSAVADVTGPSAIGTSTWHHIVGVADKSVPSIQLYLDG